LTGRFTVTNDNNPTNTATHASDITMTITTSYAPLQPDIQPWADYFNTFLTGSSAVTYHDNENLELTVLSVSEPELLSLIQDLIHTKGIPEMEFDDAESHIFIEWIGKSSGARIMLQWVAANQRLVISVEIGFGPVAPTGIPGITGYLLAMFAFLAIAAALWGYTLRRRRIES